MNRIFSVTTKTRILRKLNSVIKNYRNIFNIMKKSGKIPSKISDIISFGIIFGKLKVHKRK